MVLSNIPVFSEIIQDEGVCIPYDDVDAMAQSMERVLSFSSERARLVAYGVKRVRAFSFPTLAGQLANCTRS